MTTSCHLWYIRKKQVQDSIVYVTLRYGKCVEYSVLCMAGKENLKRTTAEVAVPFVPTDTLFIR